MKRKVIIDCDPGIDDAYALLCAFAAEDLEILGITAVAGNKGLDAVSKNALRLVRFAGLDIPVYAGAEASLQLLRNGGGQNNEAEAFHGRDGMGNSGLDYDLDELMPQYAPDFILDCLTTHPSEVEIIALAPLTNLALCIEKNPELMKTIRSLTIMGGGLSKANYGPYAEFNIAADADAAKIVFDTLEGYVPITLVPLDATHQTRIDHNDLAFFRYRGKETGKLLSRISETYFEAYFLHNHYLGGVLHDLAAVLAMLDDSYMRSEIMEIEVETEGERLGQTKGTISDSGTKVITAIDNTRFRLAFTEILFPELLKEYSGFIEGK